jgi:hypothetical protein
MELLVLYSNQVCDSSPLGFTVAAIVALAPVTDEAGVVTTVGGCSEVPGASQEVTKL